MMRAMLTVACFLIVSAESSHAETRIIGVKVTKAKDSRPRVAIYSDVKSENKPDLTIDQAANTLQDAKGWGSRVIVGIEAHDVPLNDYLPLLKAVSENGSLGLAYVEGRKPGFIHENIKKWIAKQSAEVP